jgi:hypothetical protein
MNDISPDIPVWFLRHGKSSFDYENSLYDTFRKLRPPNSLPELPQANCRVTWGNLCVELWLVKILTDFLKFSYRFPIYTTEYLCYHMVS